MKGRKRITPTAQALILSFTLCLIVLIGIGVLLAARQNPAWFAWAGVCLGEAFVVAALARRR